MWFVVVMVSDVRGGGAVACPERRDAVLTSAGARKLSFGTSVDVSASAK